MSQPFYCKSITILVVLFLSFGANSLVSAAPPGPAGGPGLTPKPPANPPKPIPPKKRPPVVPPQKLPGTGGGGPKQPAPAPVCKAHALPSNNPNGKKNPVISCSGVDPELCPSTTFIRSCSCQCQATITNPKCDGRKSFVPKGGPESVVGCEMYRGICQIAGVGGSNPNWYQACSQLCASEAPFQCQK
jgi:hypothetical protein